MKVRDSFALKSCRIKLMNCKHECKQVLVGSFPSRLHAPVPVSSSINYNFCSKVANSRRLWDIIFHISYWRFQEIIDMCDFAVGLSRQLNGSVIPSELPNYAMLEMWNPLGIVGVITAFNFPCAVLGWNACLALVCGNCVVWKGAPTTPLVTIALTKSRQLVECPSIYEMLQNPGFKWNQEPTQRAFVDTSW